MKKADLFVIVMDGRIITKKVVYDTALYELESETEYLTTLETNEMEVIYERDLKEKYIKLYDYHRWMKNDSYIYVGSVLC